MMGGWGYGPGYYGMNSGYWWMGLLGMAVQLLFWAGIIVLGVYLFRRFAGPSQGRQQAHDSALDILRERYARGEIDSEEYQRRKQELS